MAWYDDGTIAVTGGSAAVVGTGTAFVENVKIGDALRGPDERLYQVASVNSATSLTLTRNYGGATAAGQTYEIVPLQDAMAVLARNVAALIEDYQDIADNAGQGMFGDGTVGTPGMRFANDQDTGIWRPSANAIAVALAGAEHFRLTSTGAGFGTTTPAAKMHAKSAAELARLETTAARGSGNGYFSIWDPTGRKCFIGYGASDDGLDLANEMNGPLRMYANGGERMRIDANGRLGIGTAAPGDKVDVRFTGSQGVRVVSDDGNSAYLSLVSLGHIGWSLISQADGALVMKADGSERMRLDSSGNFLVGATSSSWHYISRNVAEGSPILEIGKYGNAAVAFYFASSTGASAAATAITVPKNSVTSRSINAAGTINASGADYAEYMIRAAGCGMVAKGDVCGVDIDGKLTQSWAAARSFVIKSTDPSLVGGDSWASGLDPRPEPPSPVGGSPVAPIAPEPFTESMPTQQEGEEQEAFLRRLAEFYARANAAAAAAVTYQQQADAFADQFAAWESASAAYAADLAQYEIDLAAWEAALEAERVKVDRIAFCGQVPANLTGEFAVGDYVVPAEGDGFTITAIAAPESAITFEQYRRRIGKVWAIREGRAWIDVQHG